MNAEVIKAMNKAEKKHTIRNWWRKNNRKVLTVVFFPIVAILWLMLKVSYHYKKWEKSCFVWNEERANKILSYYIPRKATWNSKDKVFYFFDNGLGWSLSYAKRYLKRKDRRFWKYQSGFQGGQIRNYLIYKFELEGFTKKVLNCHGRWTEITFTMIEK